MRQTGITMLLGSLAVLTATEPLAAQQKAALSKPLAESAESFTQVTSIRELPSGKVLVADSRDKVVQLVDLASGTMTKVGREGGGPGEYALPMSLLPLPDGTTLLHDLLNNRFLTLGADGKPGAFLEMPRPPSTSTGGPDGGRMMIGAMRNIRGTDNRGRLYFAGSPFSATGGTADSVALLRWDRVKPTFDTVGYLRLPANSVSRSSPSPGQMTVRMGNNIRFTPAETWGVAGDGSIVRIFPSPYRVAWYSDQGKMTSGPVVPYTPLKVTEADKKEVIEAQRRNPGFTMVVGGPGGGARPGAPPPNVQAAEPEFADTKPPYDAGLGLAGAALLVAPEGEAWVLRTRPAGDKIPTYDVFDRTGTLVKKVSLNPSSRVVGFGKGVVYVARSDEDDLVYLQRFARP